jgi:Flp pilus assembly protein TadG
MRREYGQITVMTVGFFVFLGLLVVVVVNASAAFLQHQQLDNLADGAALAAADGLSRDDFYRHGVGDHVEIDQTEARRLVASYLSASGQQVTVVRIDADGDQVHVHIERAVDVAIAPPGWASRTTIVSDATSRLRLSD